MEENPTLLVVVALALIDGAGQVLMQQRPAHRAHGGLWEFPGGKLEPGEGPCAALVREIDEELGIVIAHQDLVPINFSAREAADADLAQADLAQADLAQADLAQERPMVLLLYGCHCWQGAPACEPGAALVWTAPDRLHALAMPPLDVPLAAALNRYVKTGV